MFPFPFDPLLLLLLKGHFLFELRLLCLFRLLDSECHGLVGVSKFLVVLLRLSLDLSLLLLLRLHLCFQLTLESLVDISDLLSSPVSERKSLSRLTQSVESPNAPGCYFQFCRFLLAPFNVLFPHNTLGVVRVLEGVSCEHVCERKTSVKRPVGGGRSFLLSLPTEEILLDLFSILNSMS